MFGVLGGGASGLSAALMSSDKCVLLEANVEAGGHCRSVTSEGFTFDRGPHIIFSKNKEVLTWINSSLGSNIHYCERNNWAVLSDHLVKYPVENFLGMAGPEIALKCLASFVRAKEKAFLQELDGRLTAPRDLQVWFERKFGSELVDRYFRPYNEKLWKIALSDLSMSWSDRIPQPPVDDLISGCVGDFREGYLHQLHYSYPLRGGYQAITNSWTRYLVDQDRVALRLGEAVRAVRPRPGGVDVESTSGETSFPFVISTMPLNQLLGMVPDVPEELRVLGRKLRVNPTHVVTLGYRGELPQNYTAIYDPRPEFPANRISFPGVFSPMNVPEGYFSVQFEVTESPEKAKSVSAEAVVRACIEHAGELGLAPDDPTFKHHSWYQDAYVVYDVGYEGRIGALVEWFAERGIFLHGRFGRHRYVNVDGCLEDSLEVLGRASCCSSTEVITQRFEEAGALVTRLREGSAESSDRSES